MQQEKSYVYILSNFKRTVLYIGVTSDLRSRLLQHALGQGGAFTKKYKATDLLYFESFDSIHEAIVREKSLKGKTRMKKEQLINSVNPGWDDVSGDIP